MQRIVRAAAFPTDRDSQRECLPRSSITKTSRKTKLTAKKQKKRPGKFSLMTFPVSTCRHSSHTECRHKHFISCNSSFYKSDPWKIVRRLLEFVLPNFFPTIGSHSRRCREKISPSSKIIFQSNKIRSKFFSLYWFIIINFLQALEIFIEEFGSNWEVSNS